MQFLVNIPYRESKNRNKRFNVEYEIRAETESDALEIAKNKFNSYENFNFAAWERFMFESEIQISPLLAGKVFSLETYRDFLPQLQSFQDDEKIFFINRLTSLPVDEKCPLFYSFLDDESNARIRSLLISLIGRNGCSTGYKKLCPFLEDQDSRVRANTIEALETFGISELVPQFIALLGDSNNRVRANAIKALWKLGEKDLETHIDKMLKSYNSLMKSSALYVLGEIDFPGSVDMIARYLKDEDELVRFNAGRSLCKVIKVEELPKLLPFIGDTDDIVRLYVRKSFLKFSGAAASILLEHDDGKDLSWDEARGILKEIGDERLKAGDRIGFFKILIKRIMHYFKL
ncbi:MAG: HEAT repeat domain-containing protein [Candidatus Wallbacteria bacterium]|nr:HEAT repeat domain-containing protein [Candidatus Wallbacteria bacterium]